MIMIDKQYAMYCFCFGEMISTALEFDIIVSEKKERNINYVSFTFDHCFIDRLR